MQNPETQAPLPAQPIEYYTPNASTLPGLVKITGFVAIYQPLACILMMPAITQVIPFIYISSVIATLFSIIIGIRLMLRHNHIRALFLITGLNTALCLSSFILLFLSMASFSLRRIDVLCLIAGFALFLNLGFVTLILLLRHIRAHPDFPSYWK